MVNFLDDFLNVFWTIFCTLVAFTRIPTTETKSELPSDLEVALPGVMIAIWTVELYYAPLFFWLPICGCFFGRFFDWFVDRFFG